MDNAMLSAALGEITAHTRSLAAHSAGELSEAGFRRLFIRVPAVRAALKNGYTFLDDSQASIIAIWDYIWRHSEWYEVAHQALYYYQHKTLSKLEFNRIKTWVNRCDCWEHSDDLSKIYAQVVEDNPGWILPVYQSWNRARSNWKRRQSIVGLIEYASKRKQVLPFATLIDFVDPLLKDGDYYVQKGVGWTLREIYNVYPAEALAYIEHNVTLINAKAYSAATEKLDKPTKARLNAERKRHRRLG